MTDDSPKGDGAGEQNQDQSGTPRVDLPPGTGPELDRLPPPVFPPGTRRSVPIRRAQVRSASGSQNDDFPQEAFISPDDPIQAKKDREGVPDDAFISPDEPIVRTHEPSAPEDDEVKVTGIGDQDYARGEDRSSGQRRHRGENWEEVDTVEVAAILEELAEGLKARGATALLVTPDMTKVESMLRGFLAGYLVGRGD